MENLVTALAAVLEQNPGDPMDSEWIGVQSRGMKQWISARLADCFGVSANVRFVFPKQAVTHILAAANGTSPGHQELDTAMMFWSVLDQLMSDAPAEDSSGDIHPVQRYLEEDDTGRKKFQLAGRIASLFDDYMIYRPDMLMNWQDKPGRFQAKDPHTRWQAALWNRIRAKYGDQHPAWQAHNFLTRPVPVNPGTEALPPRLSFIGISALPPMFLKIFEKISDLMDIHLFLLAPSHLFFFDSPSKQQAMRAAVKHPGTAEDLFSAEETNPLLASLGRSGQDFFSQIEHINYHEPGPDLFDDPAEQGGTLLSILQSDVMNLVHRKTGTADAPMPVEAWDRSISVHSCHSPMREAQVLKDLLLEAFEADPGLMPHDIIVMMPDIESYAPFIESVFSLEHRIPFSVSDRLRRSESSFIDAFLMILSLKGSRLDQQQVLAVLFQPPVAEKFGLKPADMVSLERIIRDANILWGKDAPHRKALGLPGYEENTWQFGLNRLFMGIAMPDHHDVPVNGVLGCESFEGPELELLGKLAHFCDELFLCLDRLDLPQTMDQWCRTLSHVARTLLCATPDTREDEIFLYRAFDTLRTQARAAGFERAIPYEIIRSLITAHLDMTVSQGSFLAGRVTFCNIMPMRSIPYKIVALMGMDEAAFPRPVFGAGFDLLEKYPQKGDKNERLEDRYLFLETLLSAREKVMITYTGQDIRDNSPIPCAGPVGELMDVVNDSFVFPKKNGIHMCHPLHPFDTRYFGTNHGFFSYSNDNCRIAGSLIGTPQDQPVFFSSPDRGGSTAVPEQIDMADLFAFFRHPVEWTLKERMNIRLSGIEAAAVQREPFSLKGLDRYKIGTRLLDASLDTATANDGYPAFKAMGCLPPGQKGKHEYETLDRRVRPVAEAAEAALSSPLLSPVAKLIRVAGLAVHVYIKDIRENGATMVTFGRLTGPRILKGWIHHVCLNLSVPDGYPGTTRLIGQDPDGKKDVLTIEFSTPGATALPILETLVEMVIRGMEEPLCFFGETSYRFAKALAKDQFATDEKTVMAAVKKSEKYWSGSRFLPGEKENRYIRLCYSQNDPFDSLETLRSSGFTDLALDVFKPLLAHMREIG